MKRLVVVLVFSALVACAVWYAATRFPLETGVVAVAADTAAAAVPLPALGELCGAPCGSQRWAVKTLSDPDRESVDLRPIAATVESLTALPREPGQGEQRGGSAERHVFRVEGYLGTRPLERDRDYHAVIFGMQNQRVSMIVEIPHPDCAGACRSGFSERFAEARAALLECGNRPNPEDKPIRVRVEGVGFFDHEHGQAGAAMNEIELHPVLRFECLQEQTTR